jgi:hypothetical protein
MRAHLIDRRSPGWQLAGDDPESITPKFLQMNSCAFGVAERRQLALAAAID